MPYKPKNKKKLIFKNQKGGHHRSAFLICGFNSRFVTPWLSDHTPLQWIAVASAAAYHLAFGQGAARKASVGRDFAEDCSLTCLTMTRLTLGAIGAEKVIMAADET